MATMFPAAVSSFTTSGERTVYQFLQQTARPDRDFLVWYSPDIEDREPDFILLSPECGLIVLEVKDWQADQILEATPKDALLRTGRQEERRKQPLAQAREYVNHLMSLLTKGRTGSPYSQKRLPCPVTWGAVFPHMCRAEFERAGLDKVMESRRVLCWDEVCDDSPLRRDASGQKLRHWLRDHFPPQFSFNLTPEDTQYLRARIFPVVRLDLPRRGDDGVAQKKTVLALDHEQENLARSFGSGKLLLTGPSGSGKTVILAHQAWHLPRVNQHIRRILITCFNLSLVEYIRRLLARKGVGLDRVEVMPFYSLCERILGERLAHSNENAEFYNMVVQETLERLDGTHPLQQHWDAVLVDEGQDFSPAMAEVILRLLPQHATLTIAQDERQCLYQKEAVHWQQLGIPELQVRSLRRQYRNTRQIARMAARALGMEPDADSLAGADGPEPVWIQSVDTSTRIQDVADAAAALVHQGVAMSEIAILYTCTRAAGGENLPQMLVDALEARGVLARWAARDSVSKRNYDITTDSVTVSTIYSAKGLDFAHVFLLGLEHLRATIPRERRLAYVGMTRARERLTLAICEKKGLVATLFTETQ